MCRKYSFSDFSVSKKLIHLLRHARILREDDGAFEYWRIKDNLQKHTTSGRKAWQVEEDIRKGTSIVLIHQEQFFTSELFEVIQDVISLILLYRTKLLFRASSSSTFIMSDVQSITFHHQFGIDTWKSKFEKQTDSILSTCGSHGQKP